MKKLFLALFLALLLAAIPSYAALSATIVWEAEHAGSDTNGGCFDGSVGVPGTDYSQQASPQVTYTDLVIGGTTTQLTSAGTPFTSAHVGNCINITGGTGFTTGRYEILSVSGSTATMDRSVGTTASTSGAGKLGGALGTVGAANALASACQNLYVKADATYSISTGLSWTILGTPGGNCNTFIAGYTSVRGDNGRVTVQASANSITLMQIPGLGAASGLTVKNFILDCNGHTTCAGLLLAKEYNQAGNIVVLGADNTGISMTRYNTNCTRCYSVGHSTGAGVSMNADSTSCIDCWARGGSATGFNINYGLCVRCGSVNNTGSTSVHGFFINGGGNVVLVNPVAYGNGGSGVNLFGEGSTVANITNGIFVNNGVYGITATTLQWPDTGLIDHNFFYNNTSGARHNVTAGTGDVTGTADPFVSGSGNNFALNNTAGGGAAARAAGFPGVLYTGGTGYLDMGALQTQATGSGAGAVAIPIQ